MIVFTSSANISTSLTAHRPFPMWCGDLEHDSANIDSAGGALVRVLPIPRCTLPRAGRSRNSGLSDCMAQKAVFISVGRSGRAATGGTDEGLLGEER